MAVVESLTGFLVSLGMTALKVQFISRDGDGIIPTLRDPMGSQMIFAVTLPGQTERP